MVNLIEKEEIELAAIKAAVTSGDKELAIDVFFATESSKVRDMAFDLVYDMDDNKCNSL